MRHLIEKTDEYFIQKDTEEAEVFQGIVKQLFELVDETLNSCDCINKELDFQKIIKDQIEKETQLTTALYEKNSEIEMYIIRIRELEQENK